MARMQGEKEKKGIQVNSADGVLVGLKNGEAGHVDGSETLQHLPASRPLVEVKYFAGKERDNLDGSFNTKSTGNFGTVSANSFIQESHQDHLLMQNALLQQKEQSGKQTTVKHVKRANVLSLYSMAPKTGVKSIGTQLQAPSKGQRDI